MKKRSLHLPLLFVSCIAALFLFPTTALAIAFPVSVDSANFPDATWREAVNTNYAGGDYVLTQAEAEAVSIIDVQSEGIADLHGIGFFSDLTYLNCSNNSLISLDLTGLSKLTVLLCNGNALTVLDVPGLASLGYLDCSSNLLASLKLTDLPHLTSLNCSNNLIGALDTASSTDLTVLNCKSNSLASLDMTNSSGLSSLNCQDNSLTSLNVAGLSSLGYLDCTNNFLTILDMTGHENVTLYCDDNSLLDIVGVADSITISSLSQSRTIRMISDPSGGLMSASLYSFESDHTIGDLDDGVSFDADKRFHMDTMIASSSFSTVLGTSGFMVSGELIFDLVSHLVTFVDWDGAILSTDTIVEGSSAVAPVDPKRDGYIFTGWDTDFTYVTEDLVVVALYEKVPTPGPTPEPTPTPAPEPASPTAAGSYGLAQTGDALLESLAFATLLVAAGTTTALVARKKNRR